MSDPKKETEMKIEIPSTLPEGFAPVDPHVNHASNKFTINIANGNVYPITSDAKKPRDLFERIFCAPDAVGAIPRRMDPDGPGGVYFFPEAAIRLFPTSLEAIEAGWPPEEVIDLPEDEEDEEDEEDHRKGKKPKRPW